MYQTPSTEVRSPRYGAQSPNVRSRVMEKEELSDLNDRLATYIDRMRQLEYQNSKLSAEITTSRESGSREIDNVKSLYEAELSEARKLLDDTSKEKALLQLENKKLTTLADDLQQKLDKESNLRSRAEDELRRAEKKLHEKESLLSVISKERKHLEGKVKELEAEVKRLEEELEKQKKLLEKEIIRRVSAENRAQTLEEEAAFSAQIHAKEVDELRVTAESFKMTVDTTDGPKDYDTLLRDKLQELREEFEEEAENAKQELEAAYKSKFDEMKSSSDKERLQMSRLFERNSEVKSEMEKLRSDYHLLESQKEQFSKRITELEHLRSLDSEDFKSRLQEREDKISELQNTIESLEKEYEILYGIKIALDLEINAYRKLLEGEEERLNIPTPQSERRSSRRGTKRGRSEEEETAAAEVENVAAGHIEFEDCDTAGKFVKIKNTSKSDEPLGGWFVQRTIDGKDEEAVEYRFTPKFVLKAEQSVIIWSQSAGVKQKAPTDLVLKTGNWPVGGNMVTSVINPEAEILAKHCMKVSFSAEDFSHKRSRKRRTGAERESCAVM